MRYVIWGVVGFVLLLGLMIVGGSFYTIDQGEEGVILSNGAYVSTQGPGLHTKTPFIDNVVEITLQQHTAVYETVEAYSKDQQPAVIRISVTYHVIPGSGNKVYSEYGSVDNLLLRVVQPKLYQQLKNVFGQYDAQTAIQARAKLNTDVYTAVSNAIGVETINIDSIQIEDIKFGPAYEEAINQKQLATVEVQKQQQLLAQEQIKAQIAVTTAQGLADSQLAVATAKAKAVVLQGDAEAKAIDARGKALKDNPGVVALVQAEKWNGQLPTTMIPGDTIPFINVDSNNAAK